MNKPEITWTGTDDNLTAVVGEYELKVFYNTGAHYWTLCKGESKPYNLITCDWEIKCEAAQAAAEQAYFNHINK